MKVIDQPLTRKPPVLLTQNGYNPVAAPLTLCIEAWRQLLAGEKDFDFIVDGIVNVFHILDEHVLPESTYCSNYKSATSLNGRCRKSKLNQKLS